jgi:hypothetical protein
MRVLLLPAAALALALVLAGCTQPTVADCGLVLHMPARPIDEGVRFDAKEVVGDAPALEGLGYRITNRSAANALLFQGDLAALAAAGNHSLRYLDNPAVGFLNVGDAIVVREHGDLLLQVSRGSVLLGTSAPCQP